MTIYNNEKEVWFITGSQTLYGDDVLKQVDANSYEIANSFNNNPSIRLNVVFKNCLKSADEIKRLCQEANQSEACVGLICWMHTFSPAKMWIAGLNLLSKPFCHLNTQFNRDIPWHSIDMEYMNLHQSAHGDREFGHICSRLGKARAIIVGHWKDPKVVEQLASWGNVVRAWAESQSLKVVRFGDNMRQVAVTEGDKVEAESVFGFSVNTHGTGDLVESIKSVNSADILALCEEYNQMYIMDPKLKRGGDMHVSLQDSAKIELGLRRFLDAGGYKAFTSTFEDLHGLKQLPGLPVQRMMLDGYGFGAEGDWKHAALLRILKVMNAEGDRGTSFMEDYTYHLDPAGMRCLGSHMLEICPGLAQARPSCEIHPLGIGGKEDPVRLVFDGKSGEAVNVSLVDMGPRFRIIVNKVHAKTVDDDMPHLPVARVLWEPMPDLPTATTAWLLAGGAHHTVFSYTTTIEQVEMFADIAGVECLVIDEDTNLRQFKKELKWNQNW